MGASIHRGTTSTTVSPTAPRQLFHQTAREQLPCGLRIAGRSRTRSWGSPLASVAASWVAGERSHTMCVSHAGLGETH